MKKLMMTLIAAATVLGSTAFAKDTTVDSTLCYVKSDGRYTGEVVYGNEFFRLAVAYSNRNNSCVIAKIYGEASTSRLYYNGRRLGDRNSGMTNREIEIELAYLGLRPSSCTTFSCVESSF